MDKIIFHVFDKNGNELYKVVHKDKTRRGEESILRPLGYYISNSGNLYTASFLYDDDLEQKKLIFSLITPDKEKNLQTSIPYEILYEDYGIHNGKFSENDNGDIIFACPLREWDLVALGIFRFPSNMSEIEKSNVIQLDENNERLPELLLDGVSSAPFYIIDVSSISDNYVVTAESIGREYLHELFYFGFSKKLSLKWAAATEDRDVKRRVHLNLNIDEMFRFQNSFFTKVEKKDNFLEMIYIDSEPEVGYYNIKLDPKTGKLYDKFFLFESDAIIVTKEFLKTKNGYLMLYGDTWGDLDLYQFIPLGIQED